MYHRVFVVASLLSSYMGGSPADGQPVQVLAFAGGDVILPCSFNISNNKDFPTVEWSKEGLEPDVVFLYRDGCETYEMKNPAFEYRTSLIMKELKDGNISLRISNVQVSDTGKYQCLIFLKDAVRKATTVELDVVAVSEPKLSVISAEGGDITLHCEANCWLPEPQVTFLDDNGKNIYGENPKGQHDARGCFTVTRRATLQRATSSVTCTVHQPDFNQTRETKILIPGVCMKSDFQTIAVAIGGTALFFLVAAGFLALLCNKCFRFAIVKQPVNRKPSNQTETCESLLQPTRVYITDNLANGYTELTNTEMGFLMEDETPKLQDKVTHYHRATIGRRNSTTTADVSKPSKPFLYLGSDNKNLSSVRNPKPSSASTSINASNSANLRKSWGSKHGIKRQNSFPLTCHRSQSKDCIFSSADVLKLYSASFNSYSALSRHQILNSSVSPYRNTCLPQHRRFSILPQSPEFNDCPRILRNLPEEDEQKGLLRNEK